jgi:hypothetical protein
MTLFDIVAVFASIVGALIPVVLALEVFFFFWQTALVILRLGDDKSAEKARRSLFWGVVAIFVTVSVWGIIQFASSIFGTPGGAICPPVQILRDGVSTCFE